MSWRRRPPNPGGLGETLWKHQPSESRPVSYAISFHKVVPPSPCRSFSNHQLNILTCRKLYQMPLLSLGIHSQKPRNDVQESFELVRICPCPDLKHCRFSLCPSNPPHHSHLYPCGITSPISSHINSSVKISRNHKLVASFNHIRVDPTLAIKNSLR